MKYLFVLCSFVTLSLSAQSYITDQFLFGGTGNDEPIKIIRVQNKLYMLCRGASVANTGNLTYEEVGCGGAGALLICFDENGNNLWQKIYCGNRNDNSRDILDVGDGLVMAIASSSDAQTGNKTTPNYFNANQMSRYADYWLVKVDYEGSIIWQKTYGSEQSDWPLSLSVHEGNLLVVGYSFHSDPGFDGNISGNKTVANKGPDDTWLLLLDENGDELWQKTLGVVSSDISWTETHGGVILPNGKILSSQSSSYQGVSGDKTVENFGSRNAWLVCLDINGNQLWDKVYGGEAGENNAKILVSESHVYYIMESSSGVAGNRNSPTKGVSDILIYKLDFEGNIIDQTNYGTDGINGIYAAYLHDNRIILSLIPGVNEISIDKSEPGRGGLDAWFLSFDTETLELVNEKTYGGPGNDHPRTVVFHDNSLYMTIHSGTGTGGDKTVENFGFVNAWILKVNPTHLLHVESHFLNVESNLFPNPANNQINISFAEPTKLDKAVLYDLSGKVIREQSYAQSFEQTYLINTNGLASGVYNLSLVGDGFVKTQQVVVE